jgi:hypothetical protein
VYSLATTRDQARIVFGDAQTMARQSAGFRSRFGVTVGAHNIHVLKSGSKFEALSAEGLQQAQPPAQKPADDGTAARMRALVASSGARLARRIHRAGKVGENDIALIADALAVPVDRVNDWAQALGDTPMAETELTDSLISLGTNR